MRGGAGWCSAEGRPGRRPARGKCPSPFTARIGCGPLTAAGDAPVAARTPLRGARALDDAVFRAWQTGDAAARAVAWDALWRSVFSTAVIYCGCFSPDLGERRRWAAVAFERALDGIEPKIGRGRLTWYGRLAFVAPRQSWVELEAR